MIDQETRAAPEVRIGLQLNTFGSPPRGRASLPLDAMRTHVCILGTTGAGKSTSAIIICKELRRLGIPVAILDRTGEYVEALGPLGARVLRPGHDLAIAPFNRSKEKDLATQIEDWISLMDDFFHVSYAAGLSPLQGRVLREVLGAYYHGTNETLTISRLISKLEEYEKKTRAVGGWLESFEALISRLYPLTVDLVGKTLNRSYDTFEVGQLFEPSIVIIDLSTLPDDRARNLVSQVILKKTFDAARSRGRTSELRLVMVIDEAQHLAPGDESYISIPERCAIELRKYGFSLVTCATRPSLISPNIIANSNTLIAHMLNNRHDIEKVAAYLVGSPDHWAQVIRTLPVGYATVQFNNPAPKQAMLCKMEDVR